MGKVKTVMMDLLDQGYSEQEVNEFFHDAPYENDLTDTDLELMAEFEGLFDEHGDDDVLDPDFDDLDIDLEKLYG